MALPLEKYSQFIKAEAQRLGFLFCGISPAGFLEEEAPLLEKWLKNSYQGEMTYMENHFDKRLDPRLLVEGAKSVISLGLNYYSEAQQSDPDAPKISMYAYGEDYHSVIKAKLKTLLNNMQEEIGDVHGRAFVDSAPVLDKAWAKKAGLGWVGKHSNLINQQNGSYFFLAELILDVDGDTSITADTDDRIDFKLGNVEHISINNSSGDTVIKPMVDAKDIKFQQYDGRTLLDINDGGYVAIANGFEYS